MDRLPGDDITRSSTDFDKRLHAAVKRARELPDEEFAHLPVDVATEAIVNEYVAEPIVVDHEGLSIAQEPVSPTKDSDEYRVRLCYVIDAAGAAKGLLGRTRVAIQMETSGDRPTRMTWRVCEGTDEQIAQLEADGLDESVTWFHEHLQETADQINDEITTHRDTMREQVAAILTARSKRIKAVRKAADALGIPLHPRGENERMPLRTRALTVRQLDEAVAAGTPEWHLEHAIAEQVVATITSFTTALERLVRTADKLARESEETLRDLLLFILNANFEGQATGETFTGIGKSDILLRWKDRNAFICECKFWTGPEGFAKAIDQLDGYTVWRDTRIGLILFIRDRADVTAAIDSARSVLAEHSRLVQALDPTEPERRCDYLMHASDDQRRVIRLSLLPVHIPRQS